MHRLYCSKVKLNAIYDTISPICDRCKKWQRAPFHICSGFVLSCLIFILAILGTSEKSSPRVWGPPWKTAIAVVEYGPC